MVKNCKECSMEIEENAQTCVYCKTDQRSFFRKHYITSTLITIVLASYITYTFLLAPKTSPPDFSASVPGLHNPEAVRISAADLVAAYSASERHANEAYKGKLAEIPGIVTRVEGLSGRPYIILSSGTRLTQTNVQCYFNDLAEIGKISRLKRGDEVIVFGYVEGKALNVLVNNCSLYVE